MTPQPLIAYHGDPKLKETVMAKIAMHRAADAIAKRAYVKTNANGTTTYCAIGCLLEDPEGGHARYETEFGVPPPLAHLEDRIFERLPEEHAIPWPERFMGAIQPSADLSTVWPQFAIWLMVDPKWGMENLTKADDVKAICERVADGYQRNLDENPLSDKDAAALTRDALADAQAARNTRAAWAWDAWAAWADSWEAWAAWTQPPRAAQAAWTARHARHARDARDAWAHAAAAWHARDTFVMASSDELIRLLETAPILKLAK